MRILVVDDHPPTQQLLRARLEGEGHAVQVAGSCAEASAAALGKRGPEVIVLDVMLPDGSGVELCRSLRADGVTAPVLLLTARGDVRDRVIGLDAGADDYMPKPFAVSELLSRVRALGRRGPVLRTSSVTCGPLTIDLERRRVLKEGAPIPLTARELAIIEALALRPGAVQPRDELIESIWGEVTDSARASFEVLMARVRRKLGGAAAPIRTIRNLGYVLDVDP